MTPRHVDPRAAATPTGAPDSTPPGSAPSDSLTDLVARVRQEAGVHRRRQHRTEPVDPEGDDRDREGGDHQAVRPRARWAVTAGAAVVLLVVAALVTLGWGVRTAAGVPGVPVPERSADTAEAAGAAGAGAAGADAGADAAGAADAGAAPTSPDEPGDGSPAGMPVGAPAAAPMPAGELVVHVVGQVVAPGLARLPVGSRVADAVDATGGPTPDADLVRVNLARPLVDGEQVVVPRPGEELEPAAVPVAPLGGTGASAGGVGPVDASAPPGAVGAAGAPVDLNTATVAELDELPGIGPVLSGRIVEFRTQMGRFSSVDELAEVSGIGDVLLERLRPLVRV